MIRPKDLPEFDNPPLVETVLGLQFEPVPGFSAAKSGLLWQGFRNDFPNLEEQPPLQPVIEEYDTPSRPPVRVTIEEGLRTPRVWFLNGSGTRLIQVQPDRFLDNWRRLRMTPTENPYPRYEPRRAKFVEEVGRFQQFLTAEGLGSLAINQCEVTYVNHIETCGVWSNHREIGRVFTCCSFGESGFLPSPEDGGFRVRFLIPDNSGNPVGRLHVTAGAAWDIETKAPIFRMSLTARGVPLSSGMDGAMAFLDLGRQWIVQGFADLTTSEMHKVWRRH